MKHKTLILAISLLAFGCSSSSESDMAGTMIRFIDLQSEQNESSNRMDELHSQIQEARSEQINILFEKVEALEKHHETTIEP